jgi:predicted small lipoprotein YifL
MQINTIFKNIFYTFSAFLLILSLSGCGTKPIHDVEQHAVPSNVQSSKQVKDAIIRAGASLGWIIKAKDKNHLEGTLLLRTHVAKISIPYSKDAYSLIYQSSQNLDYNAEDKTIHNNYNGWISNLDKNIQVQLSVM